MKKSKYSLMSIVVISLIMMIAACGSPPKPAESESNEDNAESSNGSESLTVAIFGGSWGDAIKENLIKPFEEEHGVKVNLVEGTSSVTLSQLKQEKNSPTFDVALMDSGISELAYEEGLVETFDISEFADAGSLIDQGIQKDGDEVFGVALGYWGLGLIYNTEKIETPPKSWMDLWKPEYEDVVTIPSPDTTGGLPLVTKIAEEEGSIDAAFEKLSELKAIAYFDGSGSADNLYQTSEAWIGAHYGGPAWSLKDDGVPVEFVVPEEGVLGAGSYWHLVNGAPNKELATKFLEKSIGVEAQKGVAEHLYLAPVNKDVELSEHALERMPFGKDGSIDDIYMPDYQNINENRSEWVERWNREVVQ